MSREARVEWDGKERRDDAIGLLFIVQLILPAAGTAQSRTVPAAENIKGTSKQQAGLLQTAFEEDMTVSRHWLHTTDGARLELSPR